MLEKTNTKNVGLIVILSIALSIGPVSDLSAQTGYAQGCANAKQGSSFMEDYMCFPSGGSGSTTSPAQTGSGSTTSPAQTGSGINWLELCRNPIVDSVVSEPCESLTSPDGYSLTQVGQRVVACILGAGVLLAADNSGQALVVAQGLASRAGLCTGGIPTSNGSPIDNTN